MILGAGWLLLANVASVLWARELAARVPTGRRHLDILLFLLVRILLISATVIVAGLTWTLTAARLGSIAAVAAVAYVAMRTRRPSASQMVPRFRPTAGGVAWAAVIAIVLGRLLLQAWILAPYTGDALSYHLPKIAEWVRAGHFTYEMGPDTHAWFPAGFELVETWWVVFLHHDVLIELAGIEFLLLAAAAVFSLARHLELSAGWSAFAALAFVMTPGLHLQATSALNDLPVAALVLTTAALVVHGAPAGVLAVAFGIGIGIKGTYIYALPGLALLWRLERGQAAPFFPARAATVARLAVRLGAVAILVGGFWYARNAVVHGNPVYPAGSRGVLETDGRVTVRLGASVPGLWHNLTDLVENRMADREAAYTALSRRVSGWGPLAYACGLPALLVLLPADPRLRRLALAFVASLLSVLLLVLFDEWYLRFVMFFPAILCLAAARLASDVRAVLLVAVPALVFQFVATLVPGELRAARVKGLAAQPWYDRTMAGVFDAAVEGTEPVGYYAVNFNDCYLLYRPDFSRIVVFLRPKTPSDLATGMRERGVDVLYAVPGTLDGQRLLDGAVQLGFLRRTGPRLYRLSASH